MIKKIINKIYRHKENISLNEMMEILRNDSSSIILDVRSNQEYNEGNINGSINIPVYDLEEQAIKKIPDKERVIIVYCSAGIRSKRAIQILKKLGYKNLYNIEGGVKNI